MMDKLEVVPHTSLKAGTVVKEMWNCDINHLINTHSIAAVLHLMTGTPPCVLTLWMISCSTAIFHSCIWQKGSVIGVEILLESVNEWHEWIASITLPYCLYSEDLNKSRWILFWHLSKCFNEWLLFSIKATLCSNSYFVQFVHHF